MHTQMTINWKIYDVYNGFEEMEPHLPAYARACNLKKQTPAFVDEKWKKQKEQHTPKNHSIFRERFVCDKNAYKNGVQSSKHKINASNKFMFYTYKFSRLWKSRKLWAHSAHKLNQQIKTTMTVHILSPKKLLNGTIDSIFFFQVFWRNWTHSQLGLTR